MDEATVDLSAAQILVVDDEPANIDVLRQALEAEGYEVMVASSGKVALALAERFEPDLVLLDVTMPEMDGFEVCRQFKQREVTRTIPVIFLTGRDDTVALMEGFHVGGVDYVIKPFQIEEVLVRIHTHLEKAKLVRALSEKNTALEAEIARRQAISRERNQLAGRLSLANQREAQHWGLGEFVSQSLTIKKILEDIDLLRNTQRTSVLIEGESGTGKELIARAIHASGSHREGPFVPINCASIPRELADSLLFGHLKGAFTGADQEQIGYFELAHGGTLFLDEVATMPLELQPKLLRVLEERTVLPLGERTSRSVNVRVVAATNDNLAARAEEGGFRQDLYYRLAGFAVRVPPLRERREDIGLLARHFLDIFAREMGIETPEISVEALDNLERYRFPGNVRELKNLVERALIESRGGEIRPEHLPLLALPTGAAVDTLPLNLEQAELLLIQRALKQSEGNISAAARLLGIDRAKVYRRLGLLGEPDSPGDPG